MNAPARELSWIHAGLALFAPLLALALASCKESVKAAPSFGPEVDPAEIEAALTRPMESVDPGAMKVGEFVHFAETQAINNRTETEAILSDTGQTVVGKEETADRIVYTVIQNKITYSGNESRKASTELRMEVGKLGAAGGSGPAPTGLSMVEHARHVISGTDAPLKAMAAVFAAENERRITYHNLRVSLETVAPPALVSSQPDCLGIPNCKIRLHRVAFDQVAWASAADAERVAFEFAMSPDVPYLATLMDKCATTLVPINSEKPAQSAMVLVRQCSPVLNFRWEQEPGANTSANGLDAPAR